MPASGKSGAVRVMKRFLQSGAFQGGISHRKGMPGPRCPEQGKAFKEPRETEDGGEQQTEELTRHQREIEIVENGGREKADPARRKNGRRSRLLGKRSAELHAGRRDSQRGGAGGMPCPP